MAEVIDLVKYAADNQPIDFGSTFKELLGQKALEIIDAQKQEVAASMFGNDPDEDDFDDEDLEQTLDDIEVDDLEIDDKIELSDDDIETGEEDEDY
jgi:hypothetical protein